MSDVLIYEVVSDIVLLNDKIKKFIKRNKIEYESNKVLFEETIEELKFARKTYLKNEHIKKFLDFLQVEKIKFKINTSDIQLEEPNTIKIKDSKEFIKKQLETFKKWQKDFDKYYEHMPYKYKDVVNLLNNILEDKIIPATKTTHMILARVGINGSTTMITYLCNKFKELVKKNRIRLIDFCLKSKKIASFSGGKDSAWMVIECMKRGIDFNHIVYVDTTLEYPEMMEYILKFEKYIGQEVTILKPKESFYDLFNKKITRGNYEGNIRGLPFVVGDGCWIKRDMKIKQITEFKRKLGPGYVDYIGIAYNEPKRYKTIDLYTKFAPLYEWKITEEDCLNELKKINMLNPLYSTFKRLGCWCCPKQSIPSLYELYKNYPDLWNELKLLCYEDCKPFKPNITIDDLEERFSQGIIYKNRKSNKK